MTKSERQERKQKIRERYKGTDTSRIKVIPAKSSENLETSNTIRRVAAYVRVSTDNDEQTSSYELQKNYYTKYIKANQVGSSLEFMLTRASVVLLLSTERECRS